MHLTVTHDFLPKSNSTRASIVMDHFGIDFETGRHVIAEDLTLPIKPGDVVLFTGASGSGKSSLMRAAAAQLPTTDTPPSSVIDIDVLDLGDCILIDALPQPVIESMQLLSTCGLGEAHLMLRTPKELSDGQRYRFRLASALSQSPKWLLADEFTATLDRTLARVIAMNVRRIADRTQTGFLLATTHEDVIEDLAPDIHVRCRLDGKIRVESAQGVPSSAADRSAPLKKKDQSASSTTCGSQRRPKPTERTEQATAVRFVVPESEFPGPFRRRGKVLAAVAGEPLTMRQLRERTGISPPVLKSVVSELLVEGSLADCVIDKLGHRHVGYRLAPMQAAG